MSSASAHPSWLPAVASLDHKAWIKREAGQGPVAALGSVVGGKGAAALWVVLCCSCVLRSVFPEQLLVFLNQLLALHSNGAGCTHTMQLQLGRECGWLWELLWNLSLE